VVISPIGPRFLSRFDMAQLYKATERSTRRCRTSCGGATATQSVTDPSVQAGEREPKPGTWLNLTGTLRDGQTSAGLHSASGQVTTTRRAWRHRPWRAPLAHSPYPNAVALCVPAQKCTSGESRHPLDAGRADRGPVENVRLTTLLLFHTASSLCKVH
jgi:hypothetical protein